MNKDYVQRPSLDATRPGEWRKHANTDEEQRLSVIEGRLKRAAVTANENYQEKGTIMARCIRRMRRARGDS
jgi:hypothetical protein